MFRSRLCCTPASKCLKCFMIHEIDAHTACYKSTSMHSIDGQSCLIEAQRTDQLGRKAQRLRHVPCRTQSVGAVLSQELRGVCTTCLSSSFWPTKSICASRKSLVPPKVLSKALKGGRPSPLLRGAHRVCHSTIGFFVDQDLPPRQALKGGWLKLRLESEVAAGAQGKRPNGTLRRGQRKRCVPKLG